ncbi:hypothetical protein M2480_001329 [Parabacteroides sp. PFB2-12]|uniref:hypothetical protein n=1 Tax=unclassified Parabacteroides TaxID=2649774 RepID=UPI0024762745|nr:MULTISPECIES: hypothetical protein [unclassified Parabacteroides]MDH6343340.1 hypothetical protein [Parabacteroides sp. PM6-13]MDH6390356.1 hypothetical protein [Parabacteroides sp. PFB2-12]
MIVLKKEKNIICHEYGHYLVACLIGKREIVERIEFWSDLSGFYGTNVMNTIKVDINCMEVKQIKLSKKEEVLMLYGGCVACEVMGLRGKRIGGTDRQKILSLTRNAKERANIRGIAFELLEPYKSLLEAMTNKTYNYLIAEDDDVAYITNEILEVWGFAANINSLPELKL